MKATTEAPHTFSLLAAFADLARGHVGLICLGLALTVGPIVMTTISDSLTTTAGMTANAGRP